MDTITEPARAKLNITLDIVGESRGFHLLDMLVCSVDLADTVTLIRRADDKIVCYMDGVLQDGNNSAVRAAVLVRDTFKTCGFNIEINKKIPMAGGLGGSSADGVAVVRAAKKLLDIQNKVITSDWLLNLGSDAPCMYYDGVKRVRGIGEIIDLIDINLPYKVGYIAGNGVNTAAAYALFDTMKCKGETSTVRILKNADKEGFDIKNYLHNDLYLPASKLNGAIPAAGDKLRALGASEVCMSGSGSTMYGLFESDVPAGISATEFVK